MTGLDTLATKLTTLGPPQEAEQGANSALVLDIIATHNAVLDAMPMRADQRETLKQKVFQQLEPHL